MSFNKYFHDELTNIRELGREFAERNPRLAPFLTVEGQDPDVERLLEGFAFLTGRLRQKLDDELPEVTHSLMALMWPHFLRPIPAMSMLQFTPLSTLSEKQTIAKGIEVESRRVDGTACAFQTCYDVELLPLEVLSTRQHQRPSGASVSVLIGLTAHVSWQDIKLDKLPVYLHGEVHVAQLLYLWLFRYLSAIDVVAHTNDGDEILVTRLSEQSVTPTGFGDHENLLPVSPYLLNGYRLIQEYYALPEKFHFFQVEDLQCIRERAARDERVATAKSIELKFQFERALDTHVNISEDNFRLFCTPIVNLFKHDAIPVRADHKKTEYRVVPSGEDPSHYEVFDITNVQGWGHRSHQNQLFKRFESFEHFETAPVDNHKRYYRERQKPAVTGYGLDSYLSFVNQYEHSVFPETETVSIDLICTNRHLPTLLGVGDICVETGSSPEYATFENITHVTPSFAPPLDKGFHWRLISNMSLNYMSLTNLKSLKAVLSTYDYKSYYDRQQALTSQHRLDAFDGIQGGFEDRIHRGLPVRGRKTVLRLKESHFANEGDMFIFASVLNEFFALNCTMNCFHHLYVHGVENGEIYEWKPKTGSYPLL
ncbi:type VI secretion system baseplate subunit TssF [Ketobacter alkanivorans]|uniref:type VI secretion system baseplate subunit TssF n=1 Tax=Ketobacter alkanivorans TaxID=1917421 RepID=UPI0013153BC6|nr:type VI secretion system baseplate subunit TssF [Ketobacter alkanivorans]MCP5017080.1 type VI secretion system baseplate subunit TssF [Ketobacter sp.]